MSNRPTSAARPTTASGRNRPTTGATAAAPLPQAGHAARPGSTMHAVTGGRPPIGTSAGRGARMGTAARGPATARMGTAMGRMGTAMPGGVKPVARPVTQQGLSGVRPITTRGQRQVLDKSYYMGLLRTKASELSNEIGRLNKEIEHYTRESANMNAYEKKAEALAESIEDYRGELADYNTLTDRMNTSSNLNNMANELRQMKASNEHEEITVNQLFAERRQREEEVKTLEMELDKQKMVAEQIMNNIDEGVKQRYEEVLAQNTQLNDDLATKQAELHELSDKKTHLEDELISNPFKREAMALHENLVELQMRKQALESEIEAEGTPEQQRERLLEKIKTDNQEIATMDRQMGEFRDNIRGIQEEVKELDHEYEDQQGEKNARYKELKIKAQQMDDFIASFEETKQQELERPAFLEKKIVAMLAQISKKVTMSADVEESSHAQVGPESTLAELQHGNDN